MTTVLPRDAYLRAAHEYIERGWPVFLLGHSKRPVQNCRACDPRACTPHIPASCDHLTCHGFHAATIDRARFTAMREAIPGGLLAIATGRVAGLCVIDIDPRNGGTLDTTVMTPTATVGTGGGGWHLYYRHPGGPTTAKVAGRAGVDVKADGGYVCAPPSIHPTTRRRYLWCRPGEADEMPAALRAAITPTTPPPAPIVAPQLRREAAGISSPAALLAAHLHAVATAPEGRRRTILYGTARGVARMVAAGAIDRTEAVDVLTAAGHAAGQTPRETRAAIVGGFRDEAVTL